MTAALNSGSQIFQKYQQVAGQEVFSAIQKASSTTGVDFGYLLEQAQAESNFNPTVKAKSSSATGLFQFIDRTWLEMVAKHGYKHGIGRYGKEISFNPDNGRISVSNPKMKKEILDLRKDPEIASKMAAEFARENRDYLKRAVKSDVGSTEMYLAHFLGAGSAAKFINNMDRNGAQKAASLFPEAARANKPVFYNKNGTPRSLDQVYAFFDKKFSDAPASPAKAEPAKVPAFPSPGSMGQIFAMNDANAPDGHEKGANLTDILLTDAAPKSSRPSIPAASRGFASNGGLYKTISEIDVIMMSHMIRQWTQEDNSRAHDLYRTAGRYA